MAIRYFLSLSCLFHALALVFFVSLYPIVSAEAIRKEIMVYIAEAPDFSRHTEDAAGKIEARALTPLLTQMSTTRPAPITAPAKEDVRKPVDSDVRDVVDSLAGSGKVFQNVILSEAKDLTPMRRRQIMEHEHVIPAQAGIQNAGKGLDSHFRGNDGDMEEFSGEVLMTLRDTKKHENPPPLMGGGEGEGDQWGFSSEGVGQRKSEESAGDGMALGGEASGKGPSFDMEGFRDILLKEIQGRKVYPISARKLGIEGEVHITFRVFPDGQFRDITANGKQERLSILEKAAVELVRNVSPVSLPPFPDVRDISAEGAPIQVVISYQLEERKGGGRE